MFDFGPSVFYHAGSNSVVHTLISSAFLEKKTLKISQTGEIHWQRIPHETPSCKQRTSEDRLREKLAVSL